MQLSLSELERKIWQFKSLVKDKKSKDDQLSLFIEETLELCGITPKENLAKDFMICLKHFTDVQYEHIRPYTAAMRILQFISTKKRLELCHKNLLKKNELTLKRKEEIRPNPLWVDEIEEDEREIYEQIARKAKRMEMMEEQAKVFVSMAYPSMHYGAPDHDFN